MTIKTSTTKKIKVVSNSQESKKVCLKKQSISKPQKVKDIKAQSISVKKEDKSIILQTETIGIFLQSRRKQLHIKIEEVSNYLNIKPRHIELLESDKLDELEKEMVYVNGLVKSYANILQLDDELQKNLKILTEKRKKDLSSFMNVKPEINPSKEIVKYSILALIIIYLLFIVISKFERRIFTYDLTSYTQQIGKKWI